MQMYVANCTAQVQDFQYRVPESTKLMKQVIPIGGQVKISGDLSTPDIDAIVEQHSPYGLVNVDEIDRTKAFVGVCYSIGKPVNMDRVRRAIAHNLEVLNERGKTIRQEAAVSVSNNIEDNNRDFKALEMEVVEVERQGHDQQVNEAIRVDRAAPNAPPKQTRGRTRRAA